MAGVTLTAKFDDRELRGALKRVRGVGQHPARLLKRIGMGLVAAADRHFETQTDPWGRPWAPLCPAYAPLKKNSRILTESSKLVRSLTYQVGGREVSYGSAMIYAAVHQFSATIKPKKPGGWLVFMLVDAAGPFMEHCKQVFVPARPYLGIGIEEVEAIELAVQMELKRAIRGG